MTADNAVPALLQSVTEATDLSPESQELLATFCEFIVPILRDRDYGYHEANKFRRLYGDTADRLNAALNRLAARDFDAARKDERISELEESNRGILSDLAAFQHASRTATIGAEEILARHASPVVALAPRQFQGGGGGS